MPEEYTIQRLLHNTGLLHEYQRMAILDSRITPALERLLPFADYRRPKAREPAVLQTVRKATEEARKHFSDTNPDMAAALASKQYLEALESLHNELIKNASGKR